MGIKSQCRICLFAPLCQCQPNMLRLMIKPNMIFFFWLEAKFNTMSNLKYCNYSNVLPKVWDMTSFWETSLLFGQLAVLATCAPQRKRHHSCWFFGTAVVGWQWPSAGSCSCLNQEGSWIVEARCHFDRFPHLSSKWVGQPIAETD